MEAFALYLLKSVVWLTGFALVYFLFLQNERFFHLKRYYLISGIFISFIFPLFTLHYQVEIPAPEVNTAGLIPAGAGAASFDQPLPGENRTESRYLLFMAYLAGILLFAFRALKHISLLVKTIVKTKNRNPYQGRVIRATGLPGSFSFFNYVFIDPLVDENELDVIMRHELVHVSQNHWFDLLLVDFLRIFQWINPFAWIYSGFIRQNHEYIADEVALRQSANPAVYKAVLVNQIFDSRIFSLSNSFNYSSNKKRFDMMKKIAVSPYRKMKLLLVLPVFAIVLKGFATPDYSYTMPSVPGMQPVLSSVAAEKEARGTVVDEDGKPLEGVRIIVSGTTTGVTTDAKGRFSISKIPDGSSLIFSRAGYKSHIMLPLISSNYALRVRLVKDPDYQKISIRTSDGSEVRALIVIDGVISENGIGKVDPDAVLSMNVLKEEAATGKYGDKGREGVIEITTKDPRAQKKEPEIFPRLTPEDYPTFLGQKWTSYREWVINHMEYPSEAQAKQLVGWVTVNFTVKLDGSIINPKPLGNPDPILSDEVIRIITSSPKWDPPKNPAVDVPFLSSVNVGFKPPDKILDEEPFVVVEEMPLYPGGEAELLNFIAMNTQYPEGAKADTIQGKVIVRFIVNTEGNTEGISVLKGVHPLLDDEAMRVVKLFTGFKPGMQGGKAVPVWYMVPINFTLQYEKKN
jgi:TonB family protein